ncbi:phospholipid-binding protein, PBP family [Nitrosomonas cryotolerans]|nr:phospholipid-binding protein, PBP family [Nitrosomonas cryotolerans]
MTIYFGYQAIRITERKLIILEQEGIMALILTSTSFTHHGTIPTRHTCDGKNVSPALTWTGIPEGIKSLVLIVDDPDAPDPDAPKMTWVHWVLYNIPPDVSGLAEGVTEKKLPPGTLQGMNDWQHTGYGGPCPPIGRHRYFHKLYALGTMLPDLQIPTKAVLENTMRGHIIANTELIGCYQRQSSG